MAETIVTFLLLHLSDLHFEATPDSGLSPAHALTRAADAISRDFPAEKFVLAISGDVTTQGSSVGYTAALRALRNLQRELDIVKVVVCPGNHDITRESSTDFREFNQFAFSLTNDAEQSWNSTHMVRLVKYGEYAFVLVNTSFHGSYEYGLVPIDALRNTLSENAGLHLIVIIHHSPISSAYGGGGLSNAYELLSLVSEFGVAALLHGHVHSDQALPIGRHGTLLFGAGSLGFQPDGNMNNQFAIHDLVDGTIKHSYVYRYFGNTDTFSRGYGE